MTSIREAFICPECEVVVRTVWQNEYLTPANYDPNALKCGGCDHTPIRHHALEIEDGSENQNPILSHRGQVVLEEFRNTPPPSQERQG